MAPTVCLTEMPERPSFFLDHVLMRLPSSYCAGERRKSLQSRKKSQRHKQLYCDKQKLKLRMGLVLEECQGSRSPPLDSSPERDEDHNDNESDRDSCDDSRRDTLIHITLRTIALLRRNQQLQTKLSLLQAETRAFVESVLGDAAASAAVSATDPTL